MGNEDQLYEPESEEQVIRDFLQSTEFLKRKAFEWIKNNWKIEFRDYIWIAIEKEKQTQIQSDITGFIVHRLKDASLRKMIRYAESGILLKPSLLNLVEGYANYETPEVREALFKSFKRANTKIFTFIIHFFSSQKSEQMDHMKRNNFLLEILDQEIDENIKTKIMRTYFSVLTKKYDENYSRVQFWFSQVTNPIILYSLLLEISPSSMSWRRDIWASSERINLTELDSIVQAATFSSVPKIRNAAILLFSDQIPRPYPKLTKFENQKFYDFIERLIISKNDQSFIELDDYSEENLKQYFLDLAQYLPEGSDYQISYEEMRTFEIHPLDLRRHIMMGIPRKLLLDLAKNDPNVDNRSDAIIGLNNQDMWLVDQNNQLNLIGPLSFLTDAFVLCIRNSSSEIYKPIIQSSQQFLNELLRFYRFVNEEEKENLKKQLSARREVIAILDKDANKFTLEIYLFLTDILNVDLKLEIIELRNTELASFIIHDKLIGYLVDSQDGEFLVQVIESRRTKLKKILLNHIKDFMESNKDLSKNDLQTKLKAQLVPLMRDSEIRIRTLSHRINAKLG